MKFLKLIMIFFTFIILSIFLTITFYNYKFKKQIANIISNPTQAKNCYPISTKKFKFAEESPTEYIYYTCVLKPDFKSFAFFYDPFTKEVVNQQLVNTKFEVLNLSTPMFCHKYLDKRLNKFYNSCKVIISYEGYGGIHGFGHHEIEFSTPKIVVTNSK